jgi:hypothetical protein
MSQLRNPSDKTNTYVPLRLRPRRLLDRFLHHAEIITITGRSYRLRNQGGQAEEPKGNGQASKEGKRSRREPAEPPAAE